MGGNGTIGAPGHRVNIESGGILSPGCSPGTLNVAGDLVQHEASLLFFELNDPGGLLGPSDLVCVAGNLTLERNVLLDVAIQNGYKPVKGDQWTLMEYSGLTGQVSNITVHGVTPALDPGLSFSLSANSGSMFLTVVPEPITIVALGSGALALVSLSWRRRRWPIIQEPEPGPFVEE